MVFTALLEEIDTIRIRKPCLSRNFTSTPVELDYRTVYGEMKRKFSSFFYILLDEAARVLVTWLSAGLLSVTFGKLVRVSNFFSH